MKKWIRFDVAVYSMLLFFIAAIVFHALVLAGLIPFNIVWGGRLENEQQMRIFEFISISIGAAIVIVIAMKGGLIKPVLPASLIRGFLWLLVLLFSLNTVGNILAVNNLETLIFTPITLISALMCYRLAIE